MAVPDDVKRLIERFDKNADSYRSKNYNETRLRVEFLDPFFKALGWDVNNEQGYAEAYKDVIHEDAINIGGATKAPDYCFRIGSERKFFLEAKKPAVNIKEDVAPAYQLRRYAWSAKLPLSVLSDFDEFATYDCRVKPVEGDKPSTARILYIAYLEYEDRWDEIYSIFSKQAVLEGSFDKYAETSKKKKGTAEVDDAFLSDIEAWRDMLARNLALRNPNLSQRELNYSVQVTIDRIIFLRICEDRGIETYGQLLGLTNGTGIYPRLLQVFQRADDRYNSGLFHFHQEKGRAEIPDGLTPNLLIDDKVLASIIKSLYYPNSPYEFSVLPATILGHVYEQFLGKVIRLTAGHQAKVEDKPEVKKAGGVYYTPDYIVEYIVDHTVGKLLEGKTPKQAAKLKILDPACGSGSFLIGAYQKLLDWHRDWYLENEPEKRKEVYQGRGGEWKLTVAERKRILLNNIYGVDIDPQAVEVTKLSLLLKVLEGESEQSLNNQMQLFQQRALPDLSNNIKCGNSLIGPDYYLHHQLNMGDEEERWRINVFDWQVSFPEVFRRDNKGFDIVIGNPPYGVPYAQVEMNYFSTKYPQTNRFPDSYCLFIMRGLELLRDKGTLSYITPNTFCDLESCNDFRYWLLTNYSLDSLWQSGWAFKSAVVDTLVFKFTNISPIRNHLVSVEVGRNIYPRKCSDFIKNDLRKIDYRNTDSDRELLERVAEGTISLGSYVEVKAGVKMYEKGKGIPPQTQDTMQKRPYSVKGECPEGWKPLYRGEDVGRYHLSIPHEFVHYGLWLAAPRNPKLFESPKILMRRTDDRLRSCVERDSAICVNSCHVIKFTDSAPEELSYSYLVALLNSRLLQKIFEIQNPQMVGKVFAEIKVIYVTRLPIRQIDFSDKSEIEKHDSIVQLVGHIEDLQEQSKKATLAFDKDILQHQIDATDRQIDQLVYELYELTPEEIKIVEEATSQSH